MGLWHSLTYIILIYPRFAAHLSASPAWPLSHPRCHFQNQCWRLFFHPKTSYSHTQTVWTLNTPRRAHYIHKLMQIHSLCLSLSLCLSHDLLMRYWSWNLSHSPPYEIFTHCLYFLIAKGMERQLSVDHSQACIPSDICYKVQFLLSEIEKNDWLFRFYAFPV